MISAPFATDAVIPVEYDVIETGVNVSKRLHEPIEFDAGAICASISWIGADVGENNDEQRSTFEQLADDWKRTRSRGADLDDMIRHASYQRIIGMGGSATPYLLERLAEKSDHWFWALFAITGANPVRPEHEGKLAAMAEDWLAWGRIHGYAV